MRDEMLRKATVMVFVLACAASAAHGAVTLLSVADGDWHAGATWTGGPPPVPDATTAVEVTHVVDITDAGGAEALDVGLYGGRLNIYSALDAPDIFADAGPKIALHNMAKLMALRGFIFALACAGASSEFSVGEDVYVDSLLGESGPCTFTKTGAGKLTVGRVYLPPTSTFVISNGGGSVHGTVGAISPMGAADVEVGGNWVLEVPLFATATSTIPNAIKVVDTSTITVDGNDNGVQQTVQFTGNIDLGVDPSVVATFESTKGDVLSLDGDLTGDGDVQFKGNVETRGRVECDDFGIFSGCVTKVYENGTPGDCEVSSDQTIVNQGDLSIFSACIKSGDDFANNNQLDLRDDGRLEAGVEFFNGGGFSVTTTLDGLAQEPDVQCQKVTSTGTWQVTLPDAADKLTVTAPELIAIDQLSATGQGNILFTASQVKGTMPGVAGDLDFSQVDVDVENADGVSLSDLDVSLSDGASFDCTANGAAGVLVSDCDFTVAGGSTLSFEATQSSITFGDFKLVFSQPVSPEDAWFIVRALTDCTLTFEQVEAIYGKLEIQAANVRIEGETPASTFSLEEGSELTVTCDPAGSIEAELCFLELRGGSSCDMRGEFKLHANTTTTLKGGGTLTAEGLDADGMLEFVLDGTDPGEFGRLDADVLDLDGTLKLTLGPDYTPRVGDQWDLLDWVTRSGVFSLHDFPALSGGLYWDDTELYVTGTVAIQPEPTTIALLALGGLGMLVRTRRARRANERRRSNR